MKTKIKKPQPLQIQIGLVIMFVNQWPIESNPTIGRWFIRLQDIIKKHEIEVLENRYEEKKEGERMDRT